METIDKMTGQEMNRFVLTEISTGRVLYHLAMIPNHDDPEGKLQSKRIETGIKNDLKFEEMQWESVQS